MPETHAQVIARPHRTAPDECVAFEAPDRVAAFLAQNPDGASVRTIARFLASATLEEKEALAAVVVGRSPLAEFAGIFRGDNTRGGDNEGIDRDLAEEYARGLSPSES